MPPPSKVHFGIDVVIPRIMEIGMLRAPKEACGLVVPSLSVPADDWVIEMTNRADNPYSSYAIDTETVRQLLDDKDAWSDVLVWHTHPSGLVGPSQGDIKAKVEGLRYLVVALPTGEASMF